MWAVRTAAAPPSPVSNGFMLELDGIGKNGVGLLGLSMWQRVIEKLNSAVVVGYIGTEAREEE